MKRSSKRPAGSGPVGGSIHFMPPSAPSLAQRATRICVLAVALLFLAPALRAADPLSESASDQITALLTEKASRSPAQLKMDSELVYVVKRSRGEVIAPGVNQFQPSVAPDITGRVLIDATAQVTPALLTFIQDNGGIVLSSVPQFRSLRARVPVGAIETLAARSDVRFLKAAVGAITHTGSINSQGDTTHRAAQARQTFLTDGSGVKVGVLSDSVDYLAVSQTTGDLPTDVVVLPGQSGVPGSGEGTAMLEIVHDLAPGAPLYFASGFNGEAQFAQNILDLRAAGCDVIIDDIGYFDESPFQDGIVAQAVNAVTASGALYFSAAGNEGSKTHNTSGTWEGDFADGGPVGTPVNGKGGQVHSFGAASFDTVTAIVTSPTVLFWSDPLGASTNDYDLFLLDATGANVLYASTTVQNGFNDPYETIRMVALVGQRIVVVKTSGDDRFLHLNAIRGRVSINTPGNIRGHAAATNAFAVAAIDVATAFPGPFVGGARNPVEAFSTDGPRRVFYHSDGTPIDATNLLATGGAVREKPDITAADGGATTLPPTTGLNPFFGTSAAAPHAGAIAALVKGFNPLLTPAEIRAILTTNALDNEAVGIDVNSGFGIVMADRCLLATPPPTLSFVTAFSPGGGNGNLTIDPNECNDLLIVMKNAGATNNPGGTGTLFTTTPGVIILQPSILIPDTAAGVFFTNATPFKISTTPDFVCGMPIQFSFVLESQFGLRRISTTNSFQLKTGLIGVTPILANNSSSVPIPDGNTNGVDSIITISGLGGAVGKVTLSCYVTHPIDSELTLQLISPDGTNVTLARGLGFLGQNFGTNCSPSSARTTFDDNAPGAIQLAAVPFVGSFRPLEALTAFSGKSGSAVNGAWRLRAIDSTTNNVGSIQCWTLAIHPSICTDGGGFCAPDLAVSASASFPALVGSNVLYTIVVTNRSLTSPTNVVFSNALPANVTFISALPSQGACGASNGAVICDLGPLASPASATVSILVHANTLGTATNVTTVSSELADVNPADNTVQLLTAIVQPAPAIIAASATLISESYQPASGGIESGETVTVNLTLRNDGTATASNLIATLQAGNGVSAPSGARAYGALAPGESVTRDFIFTANGAPGSGILALLQLQDGLQALPSVTFQFGVGESGSFGNGAAITINAVGAAAPYPSTINVSGLVGIISKLTVTLSKLSHSFPDDIDALLVGPHGQKILLMSDCGGSNAISGKTLTFDPTASTPLPDSATIVNGIYLPSNYEVDNDLSPPAPAGPYAASFTPFIATDPNGAWSLYIMDDSLEFAGVVANGWNLNISTIVPLNPIANLAVSVTPSGTIIQGEEFSYTITVANLGPITATNIVVTNPTSPLAFISVISSAGSAALSGSNVIANIPSLVSGASATVTVTARRNTAGPFTITASVASPLNDPDLSNNSAAASALAAVAHADLSLAVVPVPLPVFVGSNIAFLVTVSNAGPHHAWAVEVTNTLPAGWVFLGATNSQGAITNSGNLVDWSVGTLAPGQVAVAAIAATAGAVGTVTNGFGVHSSIDDPNLANNTVPNVTVVNPLAPVLIIAGAALTSETAPADGAISPGETVTINFALRNVGVIDAGNVTATLAASGGVVSPGGPVAFGSLLAAGSAVSRPISFTVSGAVSGSIAATLQLQDGAQSLGSVTFNLPLAVPSSAANGSLIIIPDSGPATNYPATINVSGVSGTVSKLTVTLNQFKHTYPGDVDVLLVGPAGQKVLLMSDAGSGNSVAGGVTLTFDDAASAALPFSTALTSGTYRPTDYAGALDTFPAPAPGTPYAGQLSAFRGSNPNGTWSLFIVDSSSGDAGSVDGGWTLNLQTTEAISSGADLALAFTGPASFGGGTPISYAITVMNNGPASASSVILTNVLPANFSVTAASSSQGSVTASGGVLTANIGALASGASASVNITGTATAVGSLTNVASVSGAQADLVLSNNRLVSVVTATVGFSIQRSGSNVVLAWAASAGCVLETASTVSGPWSNATNGVSANGGRSEVTVPVTGAWFYRLRMP